MAATLVGSLLQTLPVAISPATAAPARPPIPATEKPVRGHDDASVKPRKHHPIQHPAAHKVTWPKAATATVDVAETPERAAGLPVTVAAATPEKKKPGSARSLSSHTFGKATVRVLAHDAARKAGIDGFLFTLSGGTDTGSQPGQAKISVDYRAFAQAGGADYGSRLRLVQLPACALTTPQKTDCRAATPLPGTNDSEQQTVTADAVPLPAAATSATATSGAISTSAAPTVQAATADVTVLAATTGTSGPSGDFKATPLAASSSWSTALHSGSFGWSYDMPAPPVPGDLTPKLSLAYSSGEIDGRTSNSNNQASWAGDGFDLSTGFIERSYKPCGDDGIKTDGVEPGDLCWAYDNATISFNGHAGQLIPVGTDEWRLSGDDNIKVVRKRETARANGDDDNEYFIATTADGTKYYFGYNRLPQWASGKPETKSVYTVPVFGDDAGEPCHNTTFADSWCQQGWRWNLDLVVDADGNDITYWYNQETNSYGRNLKASDDTPYVRGGSLDHIEYGQRQGDIYSSTVKPMARIDFATAERCLETGTTCDAASIDTNRQYWYDTPWDLNCKAGTDCDAGRYSPTFFTRTRLTKVTTQTLQSDGTYKPIDSWSLTHKWGTADFDYQLLLDSIQHTALAGTTPITLPKTTFDYKPLVNRLDKEGDGRAPFVKDRLGTIDDEAGGQIDVNYSAAACDWAALPTPQTNTTRCFPQIYQPTNDVAATTEWFNKYVVDAVIGTDRTGHAPDMVTHYTYLGGAAWAFDDDDGLTKEKLKTWSQWRGYAHTRVETGGTLEMSTQTDHYFLRGMDGDRSDPDDASKTRTVTVPNGEGTTLTDDEAWAGYEYRTENYDAPGGNVLAKAVNVPWKKETAKLSRSWGTLTANLTGTATVDAFTSLDGGAGSSWRETRTDTTFDNYGRATQVDDLGDTSAADDKCTRTTYADNTTGWILTGAIEVETVAAKCSATVNRDTQPDGTSAVLSDVRTRYDGQAYGAAPTKGHATLTETLKTRTGTSATYLDNATTYDVYGRPLTATQLASTSVFDTTGANPPVTTPGTNPRTTTTAYTPTTGRPTKQTVTTPPATASSPSTAQTTTTDYDLLRGLPLDTIDANGLRTDTLYDALGRTLKTWLPNRTKATGQTPNYQYTYTNDDGAIVTVATSTLNNDGSQDTSYTLYDGFGRAREVQAPGDGGGRLITDTFYDDRGQAVLTYAPYYATGAPTATLFKVEDATGVETQTATDYDGLGRPTKTTLLAGNGVGTPLDATSTVYGGDRTTVIPPKGATPTTTLFDADGQTTELRQYTDKSGTATGPYQSTTYQYDPAGHLTQLTSAGSTWKWTYDQLGRQTAAEDPDSKSTSKTYNDRGELLTTKDARGKIVAYVYDNLSRVIETRDGSATGSLLTAQAWDPAYNKGMQGTATRYVTIGGTVYQYKSTPGNYDALYRPTRTTVVVPSVPGQEKLAGTYILGTAYNLDGTTASTTYPAVGGLAAESVAMTYDSQHRLDTVTSNLTSYSYLTNQAYDLTGKPTQATLAITGGKQTWITDGYEWGTQRLTSSRTDQEGITGAARAAVYTYDQAGNVTSLTDASRTGTDTQCFSYDGLARLTDAWTATGTACGTTPDPAALGSVAPYWTTYTYNPDGTRKTETLHDPSGNTSQDTVRTYTYPTTGGSHHLDSVTGITGPLGTPVTDSYTYNDTGDTTGRHRTLAPGKTSDQVLTWDTEDKLTKVVDTVKTTTGGSTVTTTQTTDYVYDTAGNRLTVHTLDSAKPAAENTTLYLGSTEINFVKGATAATATRYYSLGEATAVRTNDNKVTFQVNDHHGTGTADIDATTGRLDQRYTTPFGTVRGTPPTNWAGTKGFVGGTPDPTGLTHLGARDYDPTTGRFISIDPVLASGDPQSLNGYTYADNNPGTLSDPTGLFVPNDGPCNQACVTQNEAEGSAANIRTLGYDPNHPKTVTVDKHLKIPVTFNHGNLQPFLDTYYAHRNRWVRYNSDDPMAIEEYHDAYSTCALAKDACTETEKLQMAGLLAMSLEEARLLVGNGEHPGAAEENPATYLWKKLSKGSGRPPTGISQYSTSNWGCEANSFPAGTDVLMADGSHKDIDKIEVGDKVLATDPTTGRSAAHTVTATIYTPADTDFADITITAGDITHSKITSTQHHPFWTPSTRKWTNAGNLKPGMTLRTDDGRTVTVINVKRYHWLHAAYNLTVQDLHTYYVLAGQTPVLVHNSNCGTGRALIPKDRIDHILDGHRHGGEPGNSHFPEGWSDDDILDAIADVATSPNSTYTWKTGSEKYAERTLKTRKGEPAIQAIFGEVRGVRIEVRYEPLTGRILTGFPTSK